MTITILLSKVCSRCKVDKPITEYHKRADRPDGVISHCKSCEKARKNDMADAVKIYSKKHYEENKEAVCQRSALKTKERRDYIEKIKDGKPCVDCGQSFPGRPEVMDFDHIDDTMKSFNLASGGWKTIEDIDKEISKCELVCANCHRTRSKSRGQPNKANAKRWKKKEGVEQSPTPSICDLLTNQGLDD